MLLVRSVRNDVAAWVLADVVKKERDVADRNVYEIDGSDIIRDSACIIRIHGQQVYEVCRKY